jgi:PAS domain S-box-containing protein
LTYFSGQILKLSIPQSIAFAASLSDEASARIELRLLAEQQLQLRQSGAELTEADTRRLVHELQIHQIELEMQNEALRTSQNETAAELHKHDGTVLEHMPCGVQLTRIVDSVIVYTNPAFEQMFGLARGALLGSRFGSLHAHGALPVTDKPDQIETCHQQTGAWSEELCIFQKEGAPFWCQINVSTFDHATFGKVWVSIYTDITDRVDLKIREAKQKLTLERAVSCADLAVWEWDVVSGCVEVDERWHALLGSSSGEEKLNVARLLTLIHPDDLDTAWLSFERHRSDETAGFQAEFRLRHNAGHWVWVLVCGRVAARNTEGEALLGSGTMIDVSQQKEKLFKSSKMLRRVIPLTKPSLSSANKKTEAMAQLSARQIEVLRHVAVGLTSKEISERMNIAPTTVNAHRRDIMSKLSLHNASALTRFAINCGLISS